MRNRVIQVRVDEETKSKIEALAASARRSVSDYCNLILIEHAKGKKK